ncbi:hypothetical protein RvY_13652 [Ramazzottius varieornatus]|uniref:BPTI/Kunitz inhibitor domain-containing protein n=1 Tax=Ramazzottius varieornatus TaxID=947166 RepID=A0A1D1VNL6_RAMVA|nr:hypothetical protein RvY_13652 [Ramazzottius varieornatus]
MARSVDRIWMHRKWSLLVVLLSLSKSHGQFNQFPQNIDNSGANPFNKPFSDPFSNFQAPEPKLNLNDQRPDYVPHESPSQYRDSAFEDRQLPGSADGFSLPGNQFTGQAEPAQQFGMPEMRQLPLPQLPSPGVQQFPNVQLPNFQEPQFQIPQQNFGGLPDTMNSGGFGNGGFGNGGFGSGGFGNGGFNAGPGWPTNNPQGGQAMGPVGAGQFEVPGMQGQNPMQQINQGSQMDFSGQPINQQFQQNQFQPQANTDDRPRFQAGRPQQRNNQFGQPAEQQQLQEQQQEFKGEQNSFNGEISTAADNNPAMVGSVKVVPMEVGPLSSRRNRNRNKQPDNENPEQGNEEIATPSSIPEGLKEISSHGGMPDCGFHGLETWQKSPCETCSCRKGITTCKKLECEEKPDDSSCIPVYKLSNCCPTFQCSNNTSRGELPTVDAQPLKEGDPCTEVGKFLPTSIVSPCSACKCNNKFQIQCKEISCPPRPRDRACKERLPKNPTVCCAEYNCPRTTTLASVSEDGTDEEADTSADDNVSAGNQFANAGQVLSSQDATTTAEPTTPLVFSRRTRARSTTTTQASTEGTEEYVDGEEDLEASSTSTSTTTTTTTARRTQPRRRTSTTSTITSTAESVSDESGDSDDTGGTTSAPRPQGVAVLSDVDTARIQEIRSQNSGPSVNSLNVNSVRATTTPQTTTASQPVRPAQSASADRGVIHDCQGGWKFPAGCDVSKDCAYVARWKQVPMDNSIRFKITTRDADKWTGIGFSKKKSLEDVDMITGWVDKSNKIMIQDRHGDAHAPILDQQQTIFNLRGSRSGNMTTIDFTRPQRSSNTQDVQIDDQNCPYFVFPVKGGAYETFTQRIQPHEDDPEMSDVGVCISKCPASEGGIEQTRTTWVSSTTTKAPSTTTTATATDNSSDYEDEATTSSAAAPQPKSAGAVSGNTGGQCTVEGAVVSLNPCQNCSCHNGLIQCLNINCRESFMQHFGCIPLFKVGVCCPSWQCPDKNTTTELAATTQTPQLNVAIASGRAGQRSTVQRTLSTVNPDKVLVEQKTQQVDSLNEKSAGGNQLDANAEVQENTTPSVLIEPHAETDVCKGFVCGTNATCVVVGAGIPGCVCKAGFEGNARIACLRPSQKSRNICSSVRCGQNAKCFNIDGRPQCKCDNGFSGNPNVACDTEIKGGFVQPPECQLRSEIGGCQNFGMRWQYDSRISGCRQFVYSGCAGNDNNFESRAQCERRCSPVKRLYKDKLCDAEEDLDSPACARCECTEQGFVACTPVSCGAPPNKDCHVIPQAGECCPKYDCSIPTSTNTSGSVVSNTRSDNCKGVICREPVFKPGCSRVQLPGECCPTIQCGAAAMNNTDESNSNTGSLTIISSDSNGASVTSSNNGKLAGVPCSDDEKISSSNPCLNCQCINNVTTCNQVICSPITPEQRRKCRITQLPNQCCLSVECFPVRQSASTAGFTTPLSTTLADVLVAEDQESAEQATTQGSTVLSTRTSTTTISTSTATASTIRRRTSTSSATTASPATTVRPTSTTATVAAAVGGKSGCSEVADAGVCRANITRYFFNAATGSCESFTYSGCGGNKNRYLTKERCEASCK